MEKEVLQLDNTKQGALTRVKNRPMGDPLCKRYFTCLLETHEQLDQVNYLL